VAGELAFSRPSSGTLVLHLGGDWRLGRDLPGIGEVRDEIGRDPLPKKLGFNSHDLDSWDSGLVSFLMRVIRICEEKGIEVAREGLPEGAGRLIELALAVPERKETKKDKSSRSFVSRAGGRVVKIWVSVLEALAFIGEIAMAFLRLFGGKTRFRGSDFLLIIQESGAEALPIVSLISLLVGLILAFVGSIQLRMFGAQIYIADLVAIAMARAMGAIMTGIIMAGRTGAAFAARIGTMQVNEEIDALKTAGIPPMEFLVLPRVLALALMMPLLALYADLMGILGGMIVGVAGFDIGFREYFNETKQALTLTNIWIGLFSSLVFGVLIAVAGCFRGIQCGRSASAVGDTTTSAVVTSIVSIIIATAIITIGCDILGI